MIFYDIITRGDFMRYFISIFLIFGLLSTYAYGTATSCKFNSKECFSKAGYVACRNRVDLDKYYEFINTDKKEISEQMIAEKNRCIKMDGNQRVAVQYNDGNKVKILFRGSNQTWWVRTDGVYSKAK